MTQSTSGRWQLWLLALIFLAPLVGAYLVYFGPESLLPEGRTESGRLISPAQPLPDAPWAQRLRGKWTLIQIADGACDEGCAQRLWETRQVRKALHRRRERVQRAFLLPPGAPQPSAELRDAHPLLEILRLNTAEYDALRGLYGPVPESRPVLLVDPLGNWLMVYGDEIDLKGLHRDIKRLLRHSQIG